MNGLGDAALTKSVLFPPAFSLSWIHYRALMSEDRKIVRDFYEVEVIKCSSGRELERHMGSLLFERLARSKDKKGLLKLANKGHEIIKPEDAIKDPIILEFLDIPESHKLVELKLEEAPYSTSCLYDYRFKDQTINTR